MFPFATPPTNNKELCDERLAICAAKHKRLRHLTRELLEEEILRAFRLKVNVRNLGEAAFAQIRGAWASTGRLVDFPWEERIMPILEKSHPRRLDLTFWSGEALCGVAVARLSDAREWISLTHIEGSPDPSHPLKKRVVPIALVGADIYASLVKEEGELPKKPTIRILNPLKESMRWYEQCGYSELQQANGYSFATCFSGGRS